MKIKNGILANSVGVLSKLTGMNLNVKVSYAIAKNISKIEKELEVYNKEKAKLINLYGEKDKKGNLKIDKGEITIKNKKRWSKDIRELNEIEVEIDIHKINEEDLFKCECDITPGELMLIDYMF